MIDIGVNLIHAAFEKELPFFPDQCQSKGIKRVVTIASDLDEAERLTQEVAQRPDFYWQTAGCHPHHADDWTEDSLSRLENLLTSKNVVAIGETGLDYNRNYSQPDNQRRAFQEQLALAHRHKIPLYLHERDAIEDQISLLKNEFNDQIFGVQHCFTEGLASLRRYLDLGLYIGITGWICDERRGHALQEAVSYIPDDRILLETDAPYLLPRTLKPRPKHSHPVHLWCIAETVAQLRGCTVAHLEQITTSNAETLFLHNRN